MACMFWFVLRDVRFFVICRWYARVLCAQVGSPLCADTCVMKPFDSNLLR